MKKIIAFCAAGAIALLAGCSSVSQEKYNSLESEESNLREQYRQLSVEHNDLQKQYDSLNSDYEELKSEYNSLQSAAESAAQTTAATTTAAPATTAAPVTTVQTTTAKPQTAKPVEVKATMGETNALNKAKDYLSIMAFSYSGLINQLEYEGYSASEATYGADHCGADWNEQAAKKLLTTWIS